MNKEVLEVLKAGRALISKPENWTQNAYARDAKGAVVSPKDPNAICFCSRGALYIRPISTIREIADDLLVLISQQTANEPLALYNDTHTHSEVLVVWDKAIAKLEQELTS